jgi:hypothetical protein
MMNELRQCDSPTLGRSGAAWQDVADGLLQDGQCRWQQNDDDNLETDNDHSTAQ